MIMSKKPENPKIPDRFQPVTPWHTPVDGAAVLDALAATISDHIATGIADARTIALWIMFAHCHDAWQHSPILSVQSPEKRCGKSTLLSIIVELVPKPLSASNVTTPVLFRSIDAFGPTLVLDETETYIRDNEEMRGVLNSGFTRSMAETLRLTGETHAPTSFSTWCPKVMALIGRLPDTLQDRSITILLRRKLKTDAVKRFRLSDHREMHMLRAQSARWANDHAEVLKSSDPDMPDGLNDRAEDAWRPLFAIADAAGEHWPETARALPFALTSADGPTDVDANTGAILLAHVRSVFEAGDARSMPPTDLVTALNANDEWPWGEWRNGQSLTARGLHNILGRYGISPHRTSTERLYRRCDFEDSWNRYL
jgi:putative DNA primase/helicase